MTNAEQEYDIQERDAVRGDLEREALAELTEERFGPLPQREPGAAGQRLRAIAAIHALADWYALHPDVPAPANVSATSFADSVGHVAALAFQLGEQPYADGRQFDVAVTGSGEDECRAVAIVAVRRADRAL